MNLGYRVVCCTFDLPYRVRAPCYYDCLNNNSHYSNNNGCYNSNYYNNNIKTYNYQHCCENINDDDETVIDNNGATKWCSNHPSFISLILFLILSCIDFNFRFVNNKMICFILIVGHFSSLTAYRIVFND